MQCNSISNVTAELKIEINLLLSERDNDNFDNDFVHLKKKIILEAVEKENLTFLN